MVGHDFDTFAEESTKMGPPKPVTNRFVNPYWHKYNEGLAKITEAEYSKGPLQAPNAGHLYIGHYLNSSICSIYRQDSDKVT